MVELSACVVPLAFSGVKSITALKQDGLEVYAPGRFLGGNFRVANSRALSVAPETASE